MARKVSGKVVVSQFHRTQKNGDVYVYERMLQYNPEKGYTVQVSSRLLGKIPAGGSEMKPTRSRGASGVRDTANSHATRKTIGAMDILEWAGHESGIDDDLLASADRGTAQKIMSVARYWTANPGGTIPRIEEWQIDHMLPYEDGLSEDMCYDLMTSIGEGASVQQNYFSARASRMPSKASVAVDSTTISSYSENLNDVRYGYNKDGDGLAAIKVMTLFCTETRQPIAFMRQPGNIPDVISVTNTVKQLDAFGMEKPLVVLDGGFFSEGNILYLMKENTKFLMRGQLDVNWILPELEKVLGGLQLPSHMSPDHPGIYGITTAIMHDFHRIRQRNRGMAAKGETVIETHRVYIYFFLDCDRQRIDTTVFLQQVQLVKEQLESGIEAGQLSRTEQNIAKKYLSIRNTRGGMKISVNDDACLREMKYYGQFCLVSNNRMDTFEALDNYMLREKTEEYFRIDKQYNDATRTRSKGTFALEGRLFCQFVAMGYEQFLYGRIRKMKSILAIKTKDPAHDTSKNLKAEKALLNWLNKMTLVKILDWFDARQETTVDTKFGRKRWKTEIIERDKLFLKYLGITRD